MWRKRASTEVHELWMLEGEEQDGSGTQPCFSLTSFTVPTCACVYTGVWGECACVHIKQRHGASHHALSVLWELLPPPPIWSPPFI